MNPMQMMMQAMQGGQSPAQFFASCGQNPQMQQLMQIVQGKSPEQLMQIADNMAKQRGTTVQALAQQMGIPINR